VSGTPEELGPIADLVLEWVAAQREPRCEMRRPTPDELRRVELCALATRGMSMMASQFGPPAGEDD